MVGVVVASSSTAHLAMVPTRILCHSYTTSCSSHEKPRLNYIPLALSNSCAFLPISGSYPHLSGLKIRNGVLTSMSSTSSGYVSHENVELPEDEEERDSTAQGEKFDWYSQWYPVMTVCDLDKRVPHGKRVMGLDVVVWWDKNESQWEVFNDLCPHRLAPLSEGRIDQWGRLQCVYHGWCFSGSGNCKLIPQAPPDGPPVHTSKKACATVYPSTVQNGIIWFWPNSDPKYKDILQHKKPPFLPELDDPSYRHLLCNRDVPYGYEVLVENLLDPSHVIYSHYGILRTQAPKTRVDREGGSPLDMSVEQLDINGFFAKPEWAYWGFIAPCVVYACFNAAPGPENTNGSSSSTATSKDCSARVSISPQQIATIIFFCIPVSPGKSRLIWVIRDFAMDQIIPRWIIHIRQNLIIDSDLYLIHTQGRKMMDLGPSNWQKVCFVPTKADALVVGFRRWLMKYSQGQVEWGDKFNGAALPPTPTREQLFDRYWSHVVNCSSCNSAYKALNLTETVLQIMSIGIIGVIGLTKQATMTTVQRSALFSMAILCFVASKWVSYFVYKTFRYHDYNHAFK